MRSNQAERNNQAKRSNQADEARTDEARTRRLLLDKFIQTADAALDQLQTWRGYLQSWKVNEETLLPLPDNFFMALINDLSEAGLLEFVDGQELDELRQAVTGVDSRYEPIYAITREIDEN